VKKGTSFFVDVLKGRPRPGGGFTPVSIAIFIGAMMINIWI
jgi:hypothetical protein